MQRQKIVAGISNSTRLNFSNFKCMKYAMIIAAFTTDKQTRTLSMTEGRNSSYARKTSSPVITTRPTQMAKFVPTLAPACASAACASELIELLSPGWSNLVLHRHQINHREHKHPDQVNKMPIQPVYFDVLGRKLASPITDRHNPQVNYADHDVRHMQPGNPEEHGAEKRGAFRVSRNGEVLFENHVHPLGQVQASEEQPA